MRQTLPLRSVGMIRDGIGVFAAAVRVGADEKTLAESIGQERAAVMATMATMATPDQREGMMTLLEESKPRFNRES